MPPEELIVAFSVMFVGTEELLEGSVLVVAGTVGAVVVAGADVVAWP